MVSSDRRRRPAADLNRSHAPSAEDSLLAFWCATCVHATSLFPQTPTCSPTRPRVPPNRQAYPKAAQVQGRSGSRSHSASSMWPYATCVSGRTAAPVSAPTTVAAWPVSTGLDASPPLFLAFCVSAITESHLRIEPGWDRRQSEQRPASRTTKSLARSGQRANHSLKLTGRPLRGRLRQPGRTIRCRTDRRCRPAA